MRTRKVHQTNSIHKMNEFMFYAVEKVNNVLNKYRYVIELKYLSKNSGQLWTIFNQAKIEFTVCTYLHTYVSFKVNFIGMWFNNAFLSVLIFRKCLHQFLHHFSENLKKTIIPSRTLLYSIWNKYLENNNCRDCYEA